MTEILEKAFAEAARLPEREQDSLGAWILAELAAEETWERSFSGSASQLSELAAEALREHAAGKTRELDPHRL